MDDAEKTDDQLELTDKHWNKVIDAAIKNGYREGIEAGKESVFQHGFDIGYEDGFKYSFQLGKYKGIATAMSRENSLPPDVKEMLEKTRRGACYICSRESTKNKNETDVSKSFRHIRACQAEHGDEIMERLRDYFETSKEPGSPMSAASK